MLINLKKTLNSIFQHKRFILFILLIGLILRLGFVFYTGGQINQPDEGHYINQAKYLFQNGLSGYWTMPTDRTPGMGLLILVSFILFGINLFKAKIFFTLLGTLTIYLVYKYTCDIFNKKVAIYASLITAFYPFFIYWSGHLMTETPAIFFTVSAILFTNRFISMEKHKANLYAILAGLSWTMLIIIRAQNFYFLPILFAFLLFKKTHKNKLLALLLFFAITVSMPFIWMYRNYKNSGLFILDTHGGITLLINTAFHNESRIKVDVAMEALEKSDMFEESKNLSLEQKEYFYRTKAIDYILKHPKNFITTRAYNFIQFWRFYPRIHIPNQNPSPFLNTKKIYFAFISLLTEPCLILMGIFGLFSAFKEKFATVLLPFSFIVFTALLHTLVFAQMRYRLPIMPIIIIFAVYGISRIMYKGKIFDEKN
ncbi:MAG: glycosyltransferase family 39 protein [Elusimicrobia bacterium]|nr:glycosyltransferase family 39 protein [Elusimicrobiota bacterium]